MHVTKRSWGWKGAIAALLAGLATFGTAQTVGKVQESKPKSAAEAVKALDAKTAEMQALEGKAAAVTKSLGELASSGKLPATEEAIALMRKMVEDMAAIRRQMDEVTSEVAEIRSWMTRQKPADDQMAKDVANLKRFKPGGYMQFQYRDTDLKGGANDAFTARRIRAGATVQIDDKTSVKYVAELASGTNQNATQLKEAFLTYDPDPKKQQIDFQAAAGQMHLPVGYEIKRSSSEREFPEHSVYNQKMFAGEAVRGVLLHLGVGKGAAIEVGGWDALAVSDPEQANLAPGPENRLGMSAALRFQGKNYQAGISGFAAERPKFVSGTGQSAVTHGRVDRRFLYVDGQVTGFLSPRIDIRAEAMAGHDRLPVSGTPAAAVTGKDMAGGHLQVTYKLNRSNHLHARFEQFDPDTDSPNNALIGYGLAWTHYLTPGAKITASHEVFDDASRSGTGVRQQRYGITTIRVQFKF